MGEVRRLIRLAWPVVLGQVGLVGMGAVDLFMVGPLGRDATAALGLGNTWSVALFIGGLGAAAGIDPAVAQAYGAGEPHRAGVAAARGLIIAAVLVVPVVVLHLLAGEAFVLFSQPAAIIPDAALYCAILALSMPPLFAFNVLRQLLQGGGVMRPAMWVILLGNLVNIAGNAALVGTYGVAGVAWSTVAVRWVMLAALLGLGWSVMHAARPRERVLQAGPLWALAALSLPVGLQVSLEIWAFNLASFVAGWLGEAAMAAHVASMNAVSIAFMAASGVAAAAATRVGNLVGERTDWRAAGMAAMALVAVVMSCSGLVMFGVPTWVARAYSSDAGVVELMVLILPIGAAFGLLDGWQVVAFGILRGLGDTRVPSLFNLIGYWLLGLPLGTYLALSAGFGLAGLWIGLAASLFVVLGLLVARILWRARAPGSGS